MITDMSERIKDTKCYFIECIYISTHITFNEWFTCMGTISLECMTSLTQAIPVVKCMNIDSSIIGPPTPNILMANEIHQSVYIHCTTVNYPYLPHTKWYNPMTVPWQFHDSSMTVPWQSDVIYNSCQCIRVIVTIL